MTAYHNIRQLELLDSIIHIYYVLSDNLKSHEIINFKDPIAPNFSLLMNA